MMKSFIIVMAAALLQQSQVDAFHTAPIVSRSPVVVASSRRPPMKSVNNKQQQQHHAPKVLFASSSDGPSNRAIVRTWLRDITGFSFRKVRGTMRATTGFSLTAVRATMRATTGISLTALSTSAQVTTSIFVTNIMKWFLNIFPPGVRYFVQPLLCFYYIPLLMLRSLSPKALKERTKKFESDMDEWRIAVRDASSANNNWPVSVNEKGYIVGLDESVDVAKGILDSVLWAAGQVTK